MKRTLSKVWQITKLLIGIGLIGWLLYRMDVRAAWHELVNGNWIWMIPLIFLFFSSLLLISPIKLQLLLGGKKNYTFRSAFDATMIGLFFNNFLPTNVGGDVVKMQYIKREGPLSWAQTLTAILTERVTGLLVLLAAFLVYIFSRPAWVTQNLQWSMDGLPSGYYWLIGAAIVLVLGVLFWVFREKVSGFLLQMYNHLVNYPRKTIFLAFLWSAVFHAARLLGLYCFLMFYGQDVRLYDLLFVLSFVAFISVIPISIGALGIRENAIAWSLSLFGVPFEVAAGLAIVNRVLFISLSLSGGVIYLKKEAQLKKESLA